MAERLKRQSERVRAVEGDSKEVTKQRGEIAAQIASECARLESLRLGREEAEERTRTLSEENVIKCNTCNACITYERKEHMATASTALRMPVDLAARYERLAKSTGRTKTFYMNEALADSIDRLEYEYGLLQQVEDFRAGKLETYSLEEVRQHCGLED